MIVQTTIAMVMAIEEGEYTFMVFYMQYFIFLLAYIYQSGGSYLEKLVNGK